MSEMLYTDALVDMTAEGIRFRRYSLLGRSRHVLWTDIEKITVKDTSLWTGKYRLHGTADFKIWFPRDLKRATRDKIFFLFLRGKKRIIGFTVEHSDDAIALFRSRGLILQEPG